MTCAFCDAPPRFVVVDLPELEHALMFGDAPTRRSVCDEHLVEHGPWDAVEPLR